MVLKADPKANIIIPDSIDKGVKCSDYPSGCVRGYAVNIKGLKMIFVEFSSRKSARLAAEKIGEYYVENWVLDNVADEPILEDFAENELSANRSKNAGPKKVYFKENNEG